MKVDPVSRNKHHGGLHMVLESDTKRNFINKLNMSGTILYGLSMSSSTNLSIRLFALHFPLKHDPLWARFPTFLELTNREQHYKADPIKILFIIFIFFYQ